jgi:hypothetical protein
MFQAREGVGPPSWRPNGRQRARASSDRPRLLRDQVLPRRLPQHARGDTDHETAPHACANAFSAYMRRRVHPCVHGVEAHPCAPAAPTLLLVASPRTAKIAQREHSNPRWDRRRSQQRKERRNTTDRRDCDPVVDIRAAERDRSTLPHGGRRRRKKRDERRNECHHRPTRS